MCDIHNYIKYIMFLLLNQFTSNFDQFFRTRFKPAPANIQFQNVGCNEHFLIGLLHLFTFAQTQVIHE